MSATAVGMPSTMSGREAGKPESGLVGWGRKAAADLWKTRHWSTANMVGNLAKHGFRKGMARQQAQMRESAGAVVRTGARVGMIAAVIKTGGAAAPKIGMINTAIARMTGEEILPETLTGVVAAGAGGGSKAAMGAAASSLVNPGWLSARRGAAPKQAPAPALPGRAP